MSLIPLALAFLVGIPPVTLMLAGEVASARSGPSRIGFLPRSPGFLALAAGLAFPLGASFIGLAYFALLPLGIDSPWASYGIAAALAASAGLFRPRAGGITASEEGTPSPGVSEKPPFAYNWAIAIVAALSLAAALLAVTEILSKSPHGAWDSWAIWSLRGKFFAGGTEFWRNAIDPGFRLSHPEYPVMLSAYLGWAWRIAGAADPGVPAATAVAYFVSLTVTAGAGIDVLRRASLGLLAIPVLLAPIVMVTVPASLYADLPMGAMSTATILLILIGFSRPAGIRCFLLAGVFASLCPWMKEEGILHLAVFAAAVIAFSFLTRAERARWWGIPAVFLASAAPLASCYAWFRLAVSPGATRFAASTGAGKSSIATRVFDPGRWGDITEQLWRMAASLGDFFSHPFTILAICILLLGIHRQRLKTTAFQAALAALLLLWAGYLGSFLLLHARPGPTLAASLHRLWLHTWPLFVITIFLLLKSPEDLGIAILIKPGRAERKQAKPPRGRRPKGDV